MSAQPPRQLPRRAFVLPALLLTGLPLPTPAQSCSATSPIQLNFGTVTAAASDAQTTLQLTCQGPSDLLAALPAQFSVCVFVGEGTPTGIAPRRMSNGNGAFMNYDLYADPARTQLIGPLGSAYAVYSLSFDVGVRQSRQVSIPLYGRVPAGQNLPATFPYQGIPNASVVRYSYGYVFTPTVDECRNGVAGTLGGAGQATFTWAGVNASYANSCRINTASDMDFGRSDGLASSHEQTSTISLQCPTGAPWNVTLNDGSNAVGSTRRMASAGNRISYELYRDANRLERWGNTAATGVAGTGSGNPSILTVYGRIPAQPGTRAGNYMDTVTVTLTY
jgi:spore coat protein U-like protein